MARFDIISKDGSVVRYSGKPRYNGVYLKPSFLEFAEIASPTPISWEVGDYVDYPRTGMRYRLYSVPQASKNARKDSHGRAFTYSHVQFHAATKELEIALFRDLVDADNNIHFSSSSDVSTFENVEGIARRIQACMDDFYPGRWEIRIADFDITDDAEVIKKIGEAKEFALSGGTCLDALSKIYELWQDIGWVYTHEEGKEVIIIGYPNKRVDENTTEAFLYGKGNGLTAIRKNQTNREEFATRLYVYGSERNLPPRYYNGKDILNAESVDIRNLMIPLDSWGKTDGLPDARKAYLENAEAVAKYGVIPKTHYFDSDDAGADIYPSIKGMTIGMIRAELESMGEQDGSYYPSEDAYPDSTQRVDLVRYCDNPTDDGSRGDVALQENSTLYGGKQRTVSIPSGSAKVNIIESELLASHSFTLSEAKPCKVVFNPSISGYVADDGFEKVEVKLSFYDKDSNLSLASATQKTLGVLNDGKWQFNLPSISYDYAQSPRSGFSAYIYLTITVTLASGNDTTAISYVLDPGEITFSLFPIFDKTFLIRLNEIGFDINAQASLGKGKAISMKTGMCAGRTFLIESCRQKSASGYWDFTVKRQQDNTLGLIFPNKDYQIAEGDEFVLIDIAMPELYILANSQKLLSEGEKLLARVSKIQTLYEPSVDAKVMAESGRVLREGMFMEITDEDVVDNTTDYILIDTLSIYEDESAIPTYKVTLKERRKVTYKGTPSATSATETESVEEDAASNAEVDVDLSDYYTKEEVNNEIEGVSEEITSLAELLNSMWHLDENGNLVTDKQVLIKNNLIVEQDTSSGGEGQDTPGAGLDEDEVLDIVKGYTYSKSEINKLIDDVNAGDVDLTNYYTKQEVDAKIPSLDGYAKEGYVDDAITALNVGQYAKASDLENLQAEVDNIETVLAGINADIAKNAENIVALDKDKADKATTLAGYGITDAYTKSDLESYKTWWDAVMGLVVKDGNNIRIKTNLIVSGDTSSGGSGQDTPASGTVTGIKVSASETLTPNNAGIIDMVSVLSSIDVSDQLKDYAKLTDIPSLDGYATETWVTNKKYLTEITKTMVDSVLGSTTAGNANRFLMSTGSTSVWAAISKTNVTDALGYTPLSTGGGTISGSASSPLKLNTSSTTIGIPLSVSNNEKAWFGWSAGQGTYLWNATANKYLGIKEDGTPHYNGNTLYHTGNFNPANYLPLSGGTISGVFIITGGADGKIVLDNSDADTNWNLISFRQNGVEYGCLGTAGDADLKWNGNTLIHSGNIGSQNAGSADVLASSYANQSINFGKEGKVRMIFGSASNAKDLGYPLQYTSGLSVVTSYTGWQMVTYGGTIEPNPYFRKLVDDGTWSAWKKLAFLDDNVASATKLETARTIWGQSFDGTGDIDGGLVIKNDSAIYIKDASGTNRRMLQLNAFNTNLIANSTYDTVLYGRSLYLAYGTSASYGLILNASGNILIGTTTDRSAKLSVYGTYSNFNPLAIFEKGDSYDTRINIKNTVDTLAMVVSSNGNGYFSMEGNHALVFETNNTERMRIASNGTVTMSSTLSVGASYSTEWDLFVNGQVGITEILKVAGNVKTNGYLQFTSIGDTTFTITSIENTASGLVIERARTSNSISASIIPLIISQRGGGVAAKFDGNNFSVTGDTNIGGNLVVSGDTSSGSDIRFKDIIKNKTIKIEHIAKAPLFTFKWNDREDDTIHLGSSAQYWEKVTPWLVSGSDFKSLNYATLGVAMGISLAKKAVNHEERIKALEKEIKRLKEEMIHG